MEWLEQDYEGLKKERDKIEPGLGRPETGVGQDMVGIGLEMPETGAGQD